MDSKASTEIFCAWDGDHCGRLAGDAVLHDQPEELARVSNAIDRGNRVFVEWATACMGRLVQTAGDEGVVVVPAAALADLPDIMRGYEGAVGATVSVGIGARLSEAGKARLVAKLRGGDQAAVWDEAMADELGRLLHGEPKTETEKLAQEYGDALKSEQPLIAVPRAPSTNGDANGGPATPAGLPISAAGSVSVESPMVTDASAGGLPVSAGLPADLVPEAPAAMASIPDMDEMAGIGNTLQDRVREVVRARELQDHSEATGDQAQADVLRKRLAGIMQVLHGNRADLEALVRTSPGVATSLGELLAAVRDLAAVGKRPPSPLGKSAKGQGGSEVGREHVVRPVGTIQEGKVKVPTENGDSWRQIRSGMVAAANGTPTSARNQHPKTGELTVG